MTSPPVVLFICERPSCVDLRVASHIWLARQAGFRTLLAPWHGVNVGHHGTSVRNAFEVNRELWKRPLPSMVLSPSVVVHRTAVTHTRRHLLQRMAHVHPGAHISFAAPWSTISRKAPSERAFRAGEARGAHVARPATFVVCDEELDELTAFGRHFPVIFKPSGGSQCLGIRLATPQSFDRVLAQVRRGRVRFVAQELMTNPVLYNGHKVDLRLYALVSSFTPLRFRVYRGGVVRIAARPFADARSDEGLAALTGCSYRKRRHVPIHNATVDEMLDHLQAQGLRVDDFWDRVDRLMHDVFTCLALAMAGLPRGALDGRFYLTGFDLILRRNGRNIEPLFLESNYVPQLNGWGPAVDRNLRAVHRDWVTDLRSYVAAAS